MIDLGRYSVCGIDIDAVDYDAAVARILDHARTKRALSVSALAVHGVMTGVLDPEHLHRLNQLDLVVPDGQPVRWALNLLHKQNLTQRVYGPELTLRVCAAAEQQGVPVYFHGSQDRVLEKLTQNLRERFPALKIAGATPSRFRQLSDAENMEMIEKISASGAGIAFVGLGCPRQEVFAFENARDLSMPLLAVGAAFDFHAGLLSQAPAWMQDRGLEWFYRLCMEPGRLWRRYAYLNPLFCLEVAKQYTGINRKQAPVSEPPVLRYG
ncbi:MAG: WecB/TagA/CpsF family glycosyltransferase [Pseudomonadota bacterium]